MKIKHSSETRKLRVYYPDNPEPDFRENVGIVKLARRTWFFQLHQDLEERLGLLQVAPKNPYEVQEISYLLRRLKKFSPVLVCDMPGWRNPRTADCRAEWLRALRELDSQLAQKVRQFIAGAGKREYLNSGGSR